MIPSRWFGKRFRVILADPPWRFETWSVRGQGRSAVNHYAVMRLEEIKALPIARVAHEDSLLFLWATSPMLPEALAVMQAWGYAYRSGAVWTKDKQGLGYWFRGQHELLLLGVRGKVPAPRPENRPTSWINAPRRAHSQKPEQVHDIIEQMAAGPYLELFGRQAREGWTVWGDEAPKKPPPSNKPVWRHD